MNQFFVLLALLASPPMPQPTADFWSRFTSPPPAGVSDHSVWFVEFGAHIDLAKPTPRKPLDRHAVAAGICRYDEPCHFRLSVLLLLEETNGPVAPVGVRYLMDRPDGTRVEGFAIAREPGAPFTFYRVRDGAWSALAPGTAEVDEEAFVSATVKYVAAQ